MSIFKLENQCTNKEEFYELLNKEFSEFRFSHRIVDKFWMAYEYYLDSMNELGR